MLFFFPSQKSHRFSNCRLMVLILFDPCTNCLLKIWFNGVKYTWGQVYIARTNLHISLENIFVICNKIQYLIWLFAWRKKISMQCSYCASGAQNCLHKVANKVAHTPMQWWSRGLLRSHPMPKFQILHKTKVGKKS